MNRIRDSFDDWSEEEVRDFMDKNLYTLPRQLPDGEWIALVRLLTTWSVCCGITPWTPFKYRWCFRDKAEALYFLETAQEFDEVPTRKTSLKGHRYTTEPLYTEKDEFGFNKW